MHVLKEFKYELRASYPGMRPRDVVIWDQFITNNPNAYVRVWYDVHIGDPVEDPAEHDKMRASGGFDVSQWCVDIVADTGTKLHVIEVKPGARAAALGQAIAYTKLLKSENRVPASAVPVVLTDEIQPITKEAARQLGVGLISSAEII